MDFHGCVHTQNLCVKLLFRVLDVSHGRGLSKAGGSCELLRICGCDPAEMEWLGAGGRELATHDQSNDSHYKLMGE